MPEEAGSLPSAFCDAGVGSAESLGPQPHKGRRLAHYRYCFLFSSLIVTLEGNEASCSSIALATLTLEEVKSCQLAFLQLTRNLYPHSLSGKTSWLGGWNAASEMLALSCLLSQLHCNPRVKWFDDPWEWFSFRHRKVCTLAWEMLDLLACSWHS